MAEKPKSERVAMREQKTLRDRAEAMLRGARTEIAGIGKKDLQALVHELQVHQVGFQWSTGS